MTDERRMARVRVGRTKLQIVVDQSLHDALVTQARAEQTTMTEILTRLAEQYLETIR